MAVLVLVRALDIYKLFVFALKLWTKREMVKIIAFIAGTQVPDVVFIYTSLSVCNVYVCLNGKQRYIFTN